MRLLIYYNNFVIWILYIDITSCPISGTLIFPLRDKEKSKVSKIRGKVQERNYFSTSTSPNKSNKVVNLASSEWIKSPDFTQLEREKKALHWPSILRRQQWAWMLLPCSLSLPVPRPCSKSVHLTRPQRKNRCYCKHYIVELREAENYTSKSRINLYPKSCQFTCGKLQKHWTHM